MVKKGKTKGVRRPTPRREAGPNKFELLGNKRRFDVLGRKSKSEVRNVGKLRSAATEKRKETLLVEYRQLRKSNTFVDRRFGEDDDSLTPDERALLRFQKQRLRELAGSKFALAEDGEDRGSGEPALLTHMGKSLADGDELGGRGWSSDDDDRFGDVAMTDMHFGGGFVPSTRPAGGREEGDDGEGAPGAHKTKKEVMEEVMAKSKMYKAMKTKQREEDDAATEALDEQWKQLTGAGALAGLILPKGTKQEVPKLAADDPDRKFDVLTRELVFEAKAHAGERTLTAEELEDLERARLEELERARVKRQRGDEERGGGDDLEDDFDGGSDGEEDLPAGGYAARRAKRAKRDAERAKRGKRGSSDDDEDSEGEEGTSEEDNSEEDDGEGLTALQRRRMERAAGAHPLQSAFRDIAAKLAAKHGVEVEGEESGSEEEEEDEEGSESGSEEEGGSEGDQEEGSGGDSESEVDEGEEEGSSDEEEEPPAATSKAATKLKHPSSALPPSEAANGSLTFTPALPASYSEFAAQVGGLSAEDLGELLRRMRGFNAAALATEGRKKMQVLYGCIVQHYVLLAGASPPQMVHLDALLPHVLELTPLVPFYAATLARARLQSAHKAMAQKLRDPVLRADAWPAPKTLLLLKLLAAVYPVSDKRHPVLTPASTFACHALSMCPLARPRDVATGLFLAALGVQMHAAAGRHCPEALHFAVELLQSAISSGSKEHGSGGASNSTPRWLAVSAKDAAAGASNQDDIVELSVQRVFDDSEEAEGYLVSLEFKTSAAAAAVRLVGTVAKTLADVDAMPEVMAPAQRALRAVARAGAVATAQQRKMANGTADKKKRREDKGSSANGVNDAVALSKTVAPAVAALAGEVLAEIDAAVAEVRARRQPLASAALVAAPEVRQYNPRYEEQYATGKDYDPDRERAERRRLKRELRKEERGAVRELRRDGAFMAGVRDKEKAALHEQLDASARRAMTFLQQQQADFKSGGQGGMWKKNKKNK